MESQEQKEKHGDLTLKDVASGGLVLAVTIGLAVMWCFVFLLLLVGWGSSVLIYAIGFSVLAIFVVAVSIWALYRKKKRGCQA